MSNYLEKVISPLIEYQFPAFYREEGPIFVEFVRAYYEWLESVTESRANTWISEGISYLTIEAGNTEIVGTNTRLTNHFANGDSIAISRSANTESYEIFVINTVSNSTYLTITTEPAFSSSRSKFTEVANTGNPVFMARHFDEIKDIDDTFENFLIYFKEKYLKNLQFINVTNTRRLVKHSLDLYRSKGTERAIELLFRITFGITPTVYYPASDLFRLSDGQWFIPTYLEVSMNPNTVRFVNKQIYGMKSGATAFAESVIRRTVGTKLIDVIYISSIDGPFQTGEPINTSDNILDPTETPIVIGSLTQIVINERGIGTGFEIGDEVDVTSIQGEQGRARVHEVTNTAGAIEFTLVNGGYGYSNSFVTYVSDKIITVANVQLSNADFDYFYPGDQVIQPMADINYISANGSFTEAELIYTYHANNDVAGTGRILEVGASNSTTGTLRVSVLSGNLQAAQFFTTSNVIVANQAASNGYWDISAWGNVVGMDDVQTLTVTGATGSFANGVSIYQYDSGGRVTGSGVLRTPLSAVSGTLSLINTTGVFHTTSPVYNDANTSVANVVSTTIRVGVKIVGANSFVNTGINYIYSTNVSTNGHITLVPAGSGANIVMSSTLLYPEYINVDTETISTYGSVALNAATYGFTANLSANLTNMAIANALSWSNVEIGKLSAIASQASGSDYGDRVIIHIYDETTRIYHLPDRFELAISSKTVDFEDGEYVSQASTGARGIVVSHTNDTITLERLNFYDANTWIPTVNTTTTIVGTSSGAVANVDVVILIDGSNELGADAIVDSDVNVSNGAISVLHVTDAGFGFVDGEEVTITAEDGTEMTGTASLQTHGFGTGFYLSQGGFLSANKKLFDGDYWQNFSYEVRSSRTLDKYLTMLREVVHVAGTKTFGAFYHDSDANVSSNTASFMVTSESLPSGAESLVVNYIPNEADVLSIDFTDDHFSANGDYGSMFVIDATTRANERNDVPYGGITFSSQTMKMTRGPLGNIRFQAHNLYLNSDDPDNQSITVISGATYAVTITGNVSMTATGATTGTLTTGTTEFTAASGTLTLTATAITGAGTVHVRRTPSDDKYMATGASAVYDIPYHWNANGVLEGMLAEPAATNLLIRSENITTGWYNLNSTDAANTATAPDGTLTASRVIENTATGAHGIAQVPGTALTDSTIYCLSFFAKSSNRRAAPVIFTKAGTYVGKTFDLMTGTIAATGSATYYGMEDWGNGWYRCWIALDVLTGASTAQAIIYIDNGSTTNFTGDGASYIDIWGAQLELGIRPTSYIPTIAATATRVRDDIVMDSTEFSLSQVEGTLFAEAIPLPRSSTSTIVELNDTTNNERYSLYVQSSNACGYFVADGGVTQAFATMGSVLTGSETIKIGMSFAENDVAASINGSITTDGVATLPTVTKLRIGNRGDSAASFSGIIRKIVYIPRRLSNTELQTLTT